jgi:hypothetical protein
MSLSITDIKDKEIKKMTIWAKKNDLEKEAERRYCEETDWDILFERLTPEEQEEWKKLYKELNGKEW